MALITTPGAANADSYATLLEADAWHAGRLIAGEWGTGEAQKEAALRMAALLLDSLFVWTGTPTDAVQALAWPRTGMLTRNGFPLSPVVIPRELKYAQAEFARQLIIEDLLANDDIVRQGIVGLKAGSIELKFAERKGETSSLELMRRPVPDAVALLLVPSWYQDAEETVTVRVPFQTL
jgi:hypothetical protein